MRSMADLNLPKVWREAASRDDQPAGDAKPRRALVPRTPAARQPLQGAADGWPPLLVADGPRAIGKIDAFAPIGRGEACFAPARREPQGWNEIEGLSRHDADRGSPCSKSGADRKLGHWYPVTVIPKAGRIRILPRRCRDFLELEKVDGKHA